MPRINYYLEDGLGIRTSIENDGSSELKLTFSQDADGYIKIKDTVYRVKYGILSIPISELPDTDCELRLYTEEESFELERFTKRNGLIEMKKTDERVIRKMINNTLANTKRIKDAEEKISILLKRTEGHHIFN